MTLLTCRHTYEETLLAAVARLGFADVRADVLAPGLVRLHRALSPDELNPAYALQILPDARLVTAPSIRALAEPLALQIPQLLDAHPGAWDIHALVPGQLKGNPKPPMRRRADLIRDAVLDRLKTTARWTLKRRVPGGRQLGVLAQFVLVDEGQLFGCVSPVTPLPGGMSWPATLPGGLADVADDDSAPASSYRKLVEAFACVDGGPQPGQTCVDLGACPGGWTRVLLHHGARVTAVDRAPLDPALMRHPDVTFVQGDAFAWKPPAPVDWLVSDIIAFPERVGELLEAWLTGGHCARFVVQMKFKGEPDWPALDAARAVVTQHGGWLVARHFFNDKNELTLIGGRGPQPASVP